MGHRNYDKEKKPDVATITYDMLLPTAIWWNVDKFSESGLTSVRSELVDASYIKEYPLLL